MNIEINKRKHIALLLCKKKMNFQKKKLSLKINKHYKLIIKRIKII